MENKILLDNKECDFNSYKILQKFSKFGESQNFATLVDIKVAPFTQSDWTNEPKLICHLQQVRY